jgi:uncharacterized protein YprB with RNaseH-like and TPR domain
MLLSSFCHIPTIGRSTEDKIWENGVFTHEDFIDSPPSFIKENKKRHIIKHLEISKKELRQKNPLYFAENLPSSQHWRIFKEYENSSVYLDIETTGLGNYGDIITTIALYDGREVKYYVNGENLDEFVKDIFNYNVIISYNGKTFDIPFIERFFEIKLDHTHLDLRYILSALGFSGGLKSCEEKLGIGRKDGYEDIDGYFAVVLWQYYKKTKDIKALETLLSYNIEDVLNLDYLMREAYNRNISLLSLQTNPVPLKKKAENPLKADFGLVSFLKKRVCHSY